MGEQVGMSAPFNVEGEWNHQEYAPPTSPSGSGRSPSCPQFSKLTLFSLHPEPGTPKPGTVNPKPLTLSPEA